MHETRKRNIIIALLCGVLLIMAVSYAAFNSMLEIKGITSITSNWNVLITNIEEKEKIGSVSSAEGYPQYEDLTATFNVNLVSPGDSISYDVTIENQGSLNAELEKININDSGNPAIKFETSGIEEGSVLKVNERAILNVKITYDESVTSQPDNTGATFKVTLDYVQEGSRGIPATHIEEAYTCPEDYEKSGNGVNTKCTKEVTETIEGTYHAGRGYYCPSGYTKNGSGSTMTCTKTTTETTNYKSSTTYTCPNGYTKSGSGSNTKCSKTETTSYTTSQGNKSPS